MHPLTMAATIVPLLPWHSIPSAAACNNRPECCTTRKLKKIIILLILPSSQDTVWFVCICARRINLPTQNMMLTILNALLLAYTKSSIGSMHIGFLMALDRVPVGELFDAVEYWQRTRVPRTRRRAESAKKSDPRKTLKVIQVLF